MCLASKVAVLALKQLVRFGMRVGFALEPSLRIINVAMDVASTLKVLGCQAVTCVAREELDEFPASEKEGSATYPAQSPVSADRSDL